MGRTARLPAAPAPRPVLTPAPPVPAPPAPPGVTSEGRRWEREGETRRGVAGQDRLRLLLHSFIRLFLHQGALWDKRGGDQSPRVRRGRTGGSSASAAGTCPRSARPVGTGSGLCCRTLSRCQGRTSKELRWPCRCQGDVRPGLRGEVADGTGEGRPTRGPGAPGPGLRTDAVGSRREGRAGPAPGSGLPFGPPCGEGGRGRQVPSPQGFAQRPFPGVRAPQARCALPSVLPSAEQGPSRAFRGLIPDPQPRLPPRGFSGAGSGPCRKQNSRPNPDPKRSSHHLFSASILSANALGLCRAPAQLGAGHAVAAEPTRPDLGAATGRRGSQRQGVTWAVEGGRVAWAWPGPCWDGPSVGRLCAPLRSSESVHLSICPWPIALGCLHGPALVALSDRERQAWMRVWAGGRAT